MTQTKPVHASVRGNTFAAIDLRPEELPKPFLEFLPALLTRVRQFTEMRRAYYDDRRRATTRWVRLSRRILALSGASALVLTGAAAAVHLIDVGSIWSQRVLVAVLVVYAVMGAIAFFDSAMDSSSSYFRYVMIILSLRDLSTKLQFEMLKEIETLASATDPAAGEAAVRGRLLSLFEAYCTDVDKASHDEATEWRSEFTASMGELAAVAKQGMEDVATRAADYAEKARQAAEAAVTAANALKPGGLNITLAGRANGDVVILLDGEQVAKGTGTSFALSPVPAGRHTILARVTSETGTIEASKVLDVGGAIIPLELTL